MLPDPRRPFRPLRGAAGPLLGIFVAAAAGAGCDDDTTAVDREPPPIPSGVYSVTGDGWVEIRWSPLVGADVAGYGVHASSFPDRDFEEIALVYGEESDSYRHDGLVNGVTLYYAVDAFDASGNRSELSRELVHDTPRPAGRGLRLYAPSARFGEAGVDWSEYSGGRAALVVAYDDPLADFVVEAQRGLLYLRGTRVVFEGREYENSLQDFGYTGSLDEIDWAPEDGWSRDTDGVELIPGHSYVFWTWDDYYGKFRVVDMTSASATLDWAFQVTDDYDFRLELAPALGGGTE